MNNNKLELIWDIGSVLKRFDEYSKDADEIVFYCSNLNKFYPLEIPLKDYSQGLEYYLKPQLFGLLMSKLFIKQKNKKIVLE